MTKNQMVRDGNIMSKAGNKPTINLGIAKSHQLAGQIVGLQLSIANLLALLVSAASVIAGATTLAVQQFPQQANWPIWLAGIGTGLALLIEGLTLSALIRMRVAARAIAEVEEKLRAAREQRLTGLSMPDPRASGYLTLKKRYQETRKLIERDFRHVRRQQTRQARRDRGSSRLLAMGGSLASMCAGGLFYHAILASLGPLASLALSGLFTLVVTGTFVSSEVFKDLQVQAIRENFANGDLAESAMRQETRLQSLWAVHARIATYLHSPEAQQSIAEGGKLLVTSILEEVHQDLRRQISRPGQTIQIMSQESPHSPFTVSATASQGTSGSTDQALVTQATHGQATVTRTTVDQTTATQAAAMPATDDQATVDQVTALPTTALRVTDDPATATHDPATEESLEGLPLSDEGMEFNRSGQKTTGSTQSLIHLDMIERTMLRALEQAAPETRADLLHLAQTETLETLTEAVHKRFPGYATLLTSERIARVMAIALQSPDTQSDTPLNQSQAASHNQSNEQAIAHSPDTQATGYGLSHGQSPAIAPGPNVVRSLRNRSTSDGYSEKDRRATGDDLSDEKSVVHSPKPSSSPGPAINNVHLFPGARVAQDAPQQSPIASHRQRIKAVIAQARREGSSPSYQEIAQAAGVGYSTVKKHAPGIRQELQAASNQE